MTRARRVLKTARKIQQVFFSAPRATTAASAEHGVPKTAIGFAPKIQRAPTVCVAIARGWPRVSSRPVPYMFCGRCSKGRTFQTVVSGVCKLNGVCAGLNQQPICTL